MQQYCQNKYFREVVKDDLHQECYKAYVYNQNYQTYINEVVKQDKLKEILEMQGLINEVREKTEENPEINFVTNVNQFR